MNPILKSLIQFLYPAQCLHCGVSLDPSAHYICKFCWEQIDFVEEPLCQTCGYPLALSKKANSERQKDIWFRKARSIANYYEHKQIEHENYVTDGIPKYSCDRCPRDIKPLFSLDLDYQNELNNGISAFYKNFGRLANRTSKKILNAFNENTRTLSDRAYILTEKKDYGWQIIDGEKEYLIRKEGERLNVYGFELINNQERMSNEDKDPISAVSKAIHLLKYEGKTIMDQPLAQLMIKNMPLLLNKDDYDLIIPLPIHKRKLHKRGYNQVELIGRKLSKAIGIPIDTQSLVKIIETESQARSSYMKRGINLKGAFDVSEQSKLEGKRILLIDDVMTTGASMNESAKALVTKGKVMYVDVLTIVRAIV